MNTFNAETSKEKLTTLKGWKFENNSIQKDLVFKNFQEAMSFMVRVSYICEAKNHHPDWTNVYNKLSIRLSTHDAKGVTEKDFSLAAEIENVL